MPTPEELVASLADPDTAVREGARQKLVAAGAAAVPALVAALGGAEPAARREAAIALGELEAREAVPALLGALEGDGYEVASWAARALGRIGAGEALDPLIARLDDESMRNAAAAALADLGDAKAVAPLARAIDPLALRFDYGSYLGRFWVAQALVRLGDRSLAAIDALKEVVDRDFGPDVQQTWGSLRDRAVDLLAETLGPAADVFLDPFLRRERETLQVRYRIARRHWLRGDRGPEIRAILERASRHPLYPALAAESRDLLATEN